MQNLYRLELRPSIGADCLYFNVRCLFLAIEKILRVRLIVPLFVICFGAILVQVDARAAGNSAAILVDSTSFSIVGRGANHRVWQKVVAQTNFAGQVIYHANRFTELATGMHQWQNGRWTDASDTIQLAPDGLTAFATNSQHQAGFAANLHVTGAVDVVTPNGHHLSSTVLGLVYADSSAKTNVVIATLQDSTGQLLPSLNQLIYTNALKDSTSSFYADVLYTHQRSRFEQDIILRQQPPHPAEFGFNPSTTVLQVWTEFFNAPEPRITKKLRAVSGQNGNKHVLEDEKLDFPAMQMGKGVALFGDASTNLTDVAINGVALTPVAPQISSMP